MTLETRLSKAVFRGNGYATNFSFGFKIWDVAQLRVVITGPDEKSEDVTRSCSVTRNASGGVVHYLRGGEPLPADFSLCIMREMPFVQRVDLESAARFDAAVIEESLDIATAERQQLKEGLDRAVKVPPTSSLSPTRLVENLLTAGTLAESALVRLDAALSELESSLTTAASSATAAAAQADRAAGSEKRATQSAGEAASALAGAVAARSAADNAASSAALHADKAVTRAAEAAASVQRAVEQVALAAGHAAAAAQRVQEAAQSAGEAAQSADEAEATVAVVADGVAAAQSSVREAQNAAEAASASAAEAAASAERAGEIALNGIPEATDGTRGLVTLRTITRRAMYWGNCC